MAEVRSAEVNVDELIRRVRSEVERHRTKDATAPAGAAAPEPKLVIDLPAPDLSRVDARLSAAEQVVAVGAAVPPMHRQRGLRRWLAIKVARAFLRVAELITRDQQTFNRALLESARALSSVVREQVERIAGHLDNVAAGLGSHGVVLSGIRRELGELAAGAVRVDERQAETLRAAQRQLDSVQAELKGQLTELRGQLAELAGRAASQAATFEAKAAEGRKEVSRLELEAGRREAALEQRLAAARLEAEAGLSALAGRFSGDLQGLHSALAATRVDLEGAAAARADAAAGPLRELSQRLDGLSGRLGELDGRVNELAQRQGETAKRQGEAVQRQAQASDRLELAVQRRQEEAAQLLGGLARRVEEVSARIDEEVQAAGQAAAGQAAQDAQATEARLLALRGELERAAQGDRLRLGNLQVAQLLQERRITTLLQAMRSLPQQPAAAAPRLAEVEQSHLLDTMYVEFEDAFRGSSEIIKGRARDYMLAPIRAAAAGAPGRPIVDLGVGRGEWLELLQEEGLKGTGVDTNRAFVEICKERGLEVVEGDALAYLKSLPDASVGAVTAIHLLEHLPFLSLVEIVDQSLRVLAPGGVAIFETPNPTNLTVGACTFYLDPTHRNPLHPETMRFLLERRGLVRVSVVPLHPESELRVPDDGSPLAQRFNDLFCGPRDFAVIGHRA